MIDMDKPFTSKPITKEIEIEGYKFTIRALGPVDTAYLGMFPDNPALVIKFLVERGTIKPTIEDANDVAATIVLVLAKEIQILTAKAMADLIPDDIKEEMALESKDRTGMVV